MSALTVSYPWFAHSYKVAVIGSIAGVRLSELYASEDSTVWGVLRGYIEMGVTGRSLMMNVLQERVIVCHL